MKLSERVRPDAEAAPWVIFQIKMLECEIDRLTSGMNATAQLYMTTIKEKNAMIESLLDKIAAEASDRIMLPS